MDHNQNSRDTTGADPGFCVRGDESRRGFWGPLKVSSGICPGRGSRGANPPPPEAPGFWVFRKLFRQQFWSILWMWWSVLKRMNLLQNVSNSFYSEQVRTLWTRCKLVILNVFIGQFWIFGHYRPWSMTATEHRTACSAVCSVQKFKIDQWKRSK
jgi:hypothetical protein